MIELDMYISINLHSGFNFASRLNMLSRCKKGDTARSEIQFKKPGTLLAGSMYLSGLASPSQRLVQNKESCSISLAFFKV